MAGERARVLVICHVSAAEAAAQAASDCFVGATGQNEAGNGATSAPDPIIDVLCYGRAGPDHPAPKGARLVGPSVQETASRREAVQMLIELRQRRYEFVGLCQPALALSRARGLLLAYSQLVSGGRAVILDPIQKRVVRPIGLSLVLADLLRWATLHLAAGALASGAVKPMDWLASRPTVARLPSREGSVIYLRTDIDLRIAPLSAGGSVAHTEGILQALLDRGHEVAYWGTGDVDGIPASVERRRLPALLKGNLPTEIAELISGIRQGLAGGRRGRRSAPTGFVYHRYSLNNLAGVIMSHRWRVPLVLEANGSEAKWRQDFGTLKYPKLAYACERLILRRADVVTAVSRNAAEDLDATGVPPDRVRVVPNGVSVRRFADASPMPLPESLEGKFTVCFVGLFYPWHGVRFLAEAFGRLHERRPDARLLLVGDGEELPVVRAILESGRALGAAHFTGLVPRPDAPRYMAAADVLVSPHADVDHFIGSPIKLFEYMAAGKPIVATRVGQIPEMLENEETALLVPPEDPDAMAVALERIQDDPAFGERLGRAAQQRAAAEHSWDARLSAILDGTRTLPRLAVGDAA